MAKTETKEVPAHIQRVQAERKELQSKFEKLGAFINTEPYNELEQADKDLLVRQHTVMREYVTVLDDRIARSERGSNEPAEQAK